AGSFRGERKGSGRAPGIRTSPENSASELAAHVAIAVSRHLHAARREGVAVPAGLREFRDALVAMAKGGQERPALASPVDDRQGGPVSFSYADAAAATGVSVRTLRRRAAEGSLRTVRVGRRVLIPAA